MFPQRINRSFYFYHYWFSISLLLAQLVYSIFTYRGDLAVLQIYPAYQAYMERLASAIEPLLDAPPVNIPGVTTGSLRKRVAALRTLKPLLQTGIENIAFNSPADFIRYIITTMLPPCGWCIYLLYISAKTLHLSGSLDSHNTIKLNILIFYSPWIYFETNVFFLNLGISAVTPSDNWSALLRKLFHPMAIRKHVLHSILNLNIPHFSYHVCSIE